MKTISITALLTTILFTVGCSTSFKNADTQSIADQITTADQVYSQCLSDVLTQQKFSKLTNKFILVSSYDFSSISKSIDKNPTKGDIQTLMTWLSATQNCTTLELQEYGRIDPVLALNLSRVEKVRLESFQGLLKSSTVSQFNNEQRNYFNNRMLAVREWAATLDNRVAETRSNYEWSTSQENYNYVNAAVGKISRYQASVLIKEIDQLQEAQGRLSVAQADYANLNPGYRQVKIANTSCSYEKTGDFVCREISF